MDRESMTSYGFLTIVTVLMAILIGVSTPLGTRMMDFTKSQISDITSSTGVFDIDPNNDDFGTLTVTYNTTDTNVPKSYSTSLKLPAEFIVPMYSKEGYTAQIIDDNGNIVSSPKISLDVGDKIKKLTVQYVPQQFMVSYELNGGNFADNTSTIISYTAGNTYKLPENIQKKGYQFVGWYTDSGLGGTRVYEITPKDIGNKVFYAKYSIL